MFFYLFWSLGVAAGGTKISINLRNHILCSNFSSQWNLYAVCATQYLLGFHVCAGEDPLIVTHIKQGFRGPRVQSLTSFAVECESWVCEQELWLAYVCLWRPKNGGEDTNKTQLVWTAPSPAGTAGLIWWKDHLKRWFENSMVVVGRFQNKLFVLFFNHLFAVYKHKFNWRHIGTYCWLCILVLVFSINVH